MQRSPSKRTLRRARALAALLGLAPACAARAPAAPTLASAAAPASTASASAAVAAPPARVRTLTLVGTSDVHGRVRSLPVLGGYLRVLRALPDRAVVALDAGDMFQGTLESNTAEGAPVVAAYNALGYAAVAIGNHEFDYGPEGDAPATQPGADPQGALRARAREARFPVLAANLLDARTNAPVAWENVAPSTLLTAGGVRVGVVGLTTEETPRATAPANFRGLAVAPLAQSAEREARALRAAGATVVVVVAHAGGRCARLDAPDDPSSCQQDAEIFRVARALPPGLVDVIVAGHTHQAVATTVNGVAIVQSYANGRAFGRVDLTLDGATGAVTDRRIFAPRELCPRAPDAPASAGDACAPGSYEGSPVTPDEAVAALLEPALERARERRAERLGVRVEGALPRGYEAEAPLVNLVADLLRAARPGADAAFTNSGGVRTDLPAGELTYGALYEAMPFDNALVELTMPARTLARAVERSLAGDRGIIALSGVRAAARCEAGALRVRLTRDNGRPLRDDTPLRVVTTDFLAQGGDAMLEAAEVTPAAPSSPATAATPAGDFQRDAAAAVLRARGGVLRGDDRALFDPARPRVAYPGRRPLRCEGSRFVSPPAAPAAHAH